jgi:hypothetical protein
VQGLLQRQSVQNLCSADTAAAAAAGLCGVHQNAMSSASGMMFIREQAAGSRRRRRRRCCCCCCALQQGQHMSGPSVLCVHSGSIVCHSQQLRAFLQLFIPKQLFTSS